MSLTGKGKRVGKTKDIRPAPTATHPIEEPYNNSMKMADEQVKQDAKVRSRGKFNPKNNAKFK